MGFKALIIIIVSTTLWMWKGEPLTPYYGYYTTNNFTVFDFFANIFVYMFAFDTWFFLTHIMLHHPYLMKTVHRYHHEFVEPSAFAQDAVHPIEAII